MLIWCSEERIKAGGPLGGGRLDGPSPPLTVLDGGPVVIPSRPRSGAVEAGFHHRVSIQSAAKWLVPAHDNRASAFYANNSGGGCTPFRKASR